MGNLWSPIVAVTTRWRGQANAQICVSIGSASIVPEKPRVLAQIYKTNHTHGMVLGSGAFALNFPRADQLRWIKDFGLVSGRDRDKMAAVDHQPGASGSPVIQDCWGYLDCRVINSMDGGDMTCFLAEVVDGGTLATGNPMWWREARHQLPAEWIEEWTAKQTGEVACSRKTMDNIDYSPWRPRH